MKRRPSGETLAWLNQKWGALSPREEPPGRAEPPHQDALGLRQRQDEARLAGREIHPPNAVVARRPLLEPRAAPLGVAVAGAQRVEPRHVERQGGVAGRGHGVDGPRQGPPRPGIDVHEARDEGAVLTVVVDRRRTAADPLRHRPLLPAPRAARAEWRPFARRAHPHDPDLDRVRRHRLPLDEADPVRQHPVGRAVHDRYVVVAVAVVAALRRPMGELCHCPRRHRSGPVPTRAGAAARWGEHRRPCRATAPPPASQGDDRRRGGRARRRVGRPRGAGRRGLPGGDAGLARRADPSRLRAGRGGRRLRGRHGGDPASLRRPEAADRSARSAPSGAGSPRRGTARSERRAAASSSCSTATTSSRRPSSRRRIAGSSSGTTSTWSTPCSTTSVRTVEASASARRRRAGR